MQAGGGRVPCGGGLFSSGNAQFPCTTGTSCIIFRKLAGESGYRQIGAVGTRKFTDEHVPPGTPSVHYMLRALRGGKLSEFSEPMIVYLGTAEMDGGGLSIAA